MEIMDLGLSHEVNSVEVMLKEVPMSSFMGEFTTRAYDNLMKPGMKVSSNRLSNCLIYETLGFEVTPVSMAIMDIKDWHVEGRSKLATLIS